MHNYTFIQQFFPKLTSQSSYNVRAPFNPTKYEVVEIESDLLDIQNDLMQQKLAIDKLTVDDIEEGDYV